MLPSTISLHCSGVSRTFALRKFGPFKCNSTAPKTYQQSQTLHPRKQLPATTTLDKVANFSYIHSVFVEKTAGGNLRLLCVIYGQIFKRNSTANLKADKIQFKTSWTVSVSRGFFTWSTKKHRLPRDKYVDPDYRSHLETRTFGYIKRNKTLQWEEVWERDTALTLHKKILSLRIISLWISVVTGSLSQSNSEPDAKHRAKLLIFFWRVQWFEGHFMCCRESTLELFHNGIELQ